MFQIRLQHVLILTASVAIMCALLIPTLREQARRRAAVDSLKAVNVRLHENNQGYIHEADVLETDFAEADLAHLQQLDNLEEVLIAVPLSSDVVTAFLTSHPNLKKATVCGVEFTPLQLSKISEARPKLQFAYYEGYPHHILHPGPSKELQEQLRQVQ